MCQSKSRARAFVTAGILLLTIAAHSFAQAVDTSGWPDRDLAKFVFERLDISSFRNSTGPRRSPRQRRFSDLGIHPNKLTETAAAFDKEGDWLYELRILGKADYNRDGVEEVAICFIDVAQNGGRYRTADHYVLQLIEGRAVALAFTEDPLAEANNCKSSR